MPGVSCDPQMIRGDRDVEPDVATQQAMVVGHVRTLRVDARACLDEDGNVRDVTVIDASGFPAFDHAAADRIRTWKYRPLVANGAPTQACTAVTIQWEPR
jgi:TonB family protein